MWYMILIDGGKFVEKNRFPLGKFFVALAYGKIHRGKRLFRKSDNK